MNSLLLSLVLSFESPGIDVGEYQAIIIYVPPFVFVFYYSVLILVVISYFLLEPGNDTILM